MGREGFPLKVVFLHIDSDQFHMLFQRTLVSRDIKAPSTSILSINWRALESPLEFFTDQTCVAMRKLVKQTWNGFRIFYLINLVLLNFLEVFFNAFQDYLALFRLPLRREAVHKSPSNVPINAGALFRIFAIILFFPSLRNILNSGDLGWGKVVSVKRL